ncbi:hypothetical protein [Haloechinothrix alba]|uniref:hypothetical protein n=1 Tax=Haloechinothrix alba TaxID=664784 RepID=UPI000B78BC52|nr:hypothetical protein [Haloechinothrix alba]
MCCPSATLAVWSSAWLTQRAASDDVLDALLYWTQRHRVLAADDGAAETFDLAVVPVADPAADPAAGVAPAHLLAALRRHGLTRAALLLPEAGDVRGLGGPGPFSRAALARGEAVVFDEIGIGLVPEQADDGSLRWTAYTAAGSGDSVTSGISEAERELRDAVRSSADELDALDVARAHPGAHDSVRRRLVASPQPPWPDDMPAQALRVLQRADEVDTILAAATDDEPGGAQSASAARSRSEALRPLAAAVREARCAAVSEAVRLFAGYADRRR